MSVVPSTGYRTQFVSRCMGSVGSSRLSQDAAYYISAQAATGLMEEWHCSCHLDTECTVRKQHSKSTDRALIHKQWIAGQPKEASSMPAQSEAADRIDCTHSWQPIPLQPQMLVNKLWVEANIAGQKCKLQAMAWAQASAVPIRSSLPAGLNESDHMLDTSDLPVSSEG